MAWRRLAALWITQSSPVTCRYITKQTVSLFSQPLQLAALVCQGVVVQNDPDNTGDMLVGNVTAQVFQLTPGQWIYLPVNDVSRVYVKMTSGSNQTVNWLAV